MTVPHATDRWLKSSRSTGSDTCVELGHTGAVRDSKNPDGRVLTVDLAPLLSAVKGDLNR